MLLVNPALNKMVCGSDMSIDCIKELFIQGTYINQTTPNFSGLGLLGD